MHGTPPASQMCADREPGNRASIEYWQALADERAQQKKAACAALETQLAQVCTASMPQPCTASLPHPLCPG